MVRAFILCSSSMSGKTAISEREKRARVECELRFHVWCDVESASLFNLADSWWISLWLCNLRVFPSYYRKSISIYRVPFEGGAESRILLCFGRIQLVIRVDLPRQTASSLFHGRENRKDARETSETGFYP